MKIFDLHADIGYDVMQKKKLGNKIVEMYHVPKFNKGEVTYVGMASYFEGEESWDDMKEMVISLKEDLTLCKSVDIVESLNDLKENDHIKAFLTIEGMCGIKDNPEEKINWLYQQGMRIGSLCWNEENELAAGAKANMEVGLKPLGKRVIEEMIRLGMLIDVSHANEKTFYDIIEYKKAFVIATHSNARALCDHPRNLTDEQIIAIAKRNGLIGINSAPVFVHPDKNKQDIPHLVKHMQYIKELVGIKYIALGMDFMDYFKGYETFHTKGLEDCTKMQKLIYEMEKQGFTEDEIKAIAYKNALRKIKEVI